MSMNAREKAQWLIGWNEVSKEAFDIAESKGFWKKDMSMERFIALVHSEVSEAFEAARDPSIASRLESFPAFVEELADVIIRILDYDKHKDLGIGAAVLAKLEYNKTREYMHGGKKF